MQILNNLDPKGVERAGIASLSNGCIINKVTYIMSCLNPIIIESPETRWLKKCRKEGRSFEYYIHQANQRRNLQFDPVPLVQSSYDYYYDGGHDYRYMSVPCGKCDLCLKARVDGYFIRNYIEWLHTTLALHGSVWFITLTYADELLPSVVIDDMEYRCFDKRDIQTFLKRLRKYSGFNFRYFIVSEFGGEFGRPHYHGLLYVRDMPSTDGNQYKMLELIANSWTRIKDRNARFSSMSILNLPAMQRVDVKPVRDEKAISYVCKYVGKQFGAVDFDKLPLPQENRRFHLQSIGLGENIYDYVNTDMWNKGFIELKGYKWSIPQYYKLKKMREYFCELEDGSIIYRPSDFKFQYIQSLCREQFEEHKSLAMLNPSYPVPPAWTYDPAVLFQLYEFIDMYMVNRDTEPRDDIAFYLSEWQDYLLSVQAYNKSAFAARAEKWRRQQLDHYNKKKGLK